MNATHEALLKGLIRKMADDLCPPERIDLLRSVEVDNIDDLSDDDKAHLDNLLWRCKSELIKYLSKPDQFNDWKELL